MVGCIVAIIATLATAEVSAGAVAEVDQKVQELIRIKDGITSLILSMSPLWIFYHKKTSI